MVLQTKTVLPVFVKRDGLKYVLFNSFATRLIISSSTIAILIKGAGGDVEFQLLSFSAVGICCFFQTTNLQTGPGTPLPHPVEHIWMRSVLFPCHCRYIGGNEPRHVCHILLCTRLLVNGSIDLLRETKKPTAKCNVRAFGGSNCST